MSTLPELPISAEDYLNAEHEAPIRSEYINGEVFAMSGASRRHVLITTNIISALKQSSGGSDCRVYANEMRLAVPAGLYTYPDVMVTCGKEEVRPGPTETLLNRPAAR